MDPDEEVLAKIEQIKQGGPERYRQRAKAEGRLLVRERLARLLDVGFGVEDGIFADAADEGNPADAVITGIGKMHGRTVCYMANDPTVKAGSWGPKTVEKILRIQETAANLRVPIVYLVDSAGARITHQVDMFPGRRHAGRIFYNEVMLSGLVPQVCLLFGPSAAGGAYIPAFCDVVVMVEGRASMYLGSPRMAEMVIGEKTTLEDMGGARMHCEVSGCGDILVQSDEQAIDVARRYVQYFPNHCDSLPEAVPTTDPAKSPEELARIIPTNQNLPFDMFDLIERIVDADSFLEIKALFAKELITGLGRIGGRVVGIVASQPKVKGGVLFVDSADKGARFIALCDAFNIPLLFLADVPGFMIGSKVERQGIIRHGAKMIYAVSEATVPKISVIVRKVYGAGLYAMCGPAYGADATLALPTAYIAVMGPEAAVNAVYYNKIMELQGEEREHFIRERREEYRRDIDLYQLASRLIVDAIVPPSRLREELMSRFAAYASKHATNPRKRHGVMPV
ncbi:MAG TPA: acyl-CoA carboxylase subunit beta [Candidatus Tectomicrobia bacterium]|nr:acyl-CoA carboxylase subunit beta [Candidatus Tectomicrobia bacterium]